MISFKAKIKCDNCPKTATCTLESTNESSLHVVVFRDELPPGWSKLGRIHYCSGEACQQVCSKRASISGEYARHNTAPHKTVKKKKK